MRGGWRWNCGWLVWGIGLLGPTVALATWSGEVWAELGMVLAILLLCCGHPTMTRLSGYVVLPFLVLSPAMMAYVWQVGAMPGLDAVQSLRLTSLRELGELLADQAGGTVWIIVASMIGIAPIIARPSLVLSPAVRRACAAFGLMYLAVGAIQYSFLRDHLPFRPWVSQEVLLRTYPFSVIEPLMTMAMAAPPESVTRRLASVEMSSRRPDRQLVVLVIGESARADHWHINGYARQTTPFLDSLDNAVVFPHVRAVADCTYSAVPALLKMLGARAFRDSRFGAGLPTLLDYFKQAGFATTVVTMQELRLMEDGVVSDRTVALRALNPDDTILDEMILPEFRRTLAGSAPRKFIVLQLFGSHFEYAQRYPPDFARLGGEGASLTQRIGRYDNSVLYTDWVLGALVGELRRQRDQEVLFAYVSDHGENLADDARGLLQHCNQPTHFDTQVAAFFWGAGVDQTDKWAQLVGNRQRYVGQEMIGPTLLDLSGIRAVGAMYPVPESLAAEINEQVSREVLSNNGLVAFDREGRVTQ